MPYRSVEWSLSTWYYYTRGLTSVGLTLATLQAYGASRVSLRLTTTCLCLRMTLHAVRMSRTSTSGCAATACCSTKANVSSALQSQVLCDTSGVVECQPCVSRHDCAQCHVYKVVRQLLLGCNVTVSSASERCNSSLQLIVNWDCCVACYCSVCTTVWLFYTTATRRCAAS
jgi:hypothetical protein